MEEIKTLIQDCLGGRRQALSQLYERYRQKMFGVCLRYASNREEAEEVLQEGFMKVFEHLHQFKFVGSFEGWVRTIMVNCALRRYRTRRHLHVVSSTDEVDVPGMDHEEIVAAISAKELLAFVQCLPPVYKMVFNLYVFEGMKHREIAAMLGISEGTSKSNLSDARRLLQRAIEKSLQAGKIATLHG